MQPWSYKRKVRQAVCKAALNKHSGSPLSPPTTAHLEADLTVTPAAMLVAPLQLQQTKGSAKLSGGCANRFGAAGRVGDASRPLRQLAAGGPTPGAAVGALLAACRPQLAGLHAHPSREAFSALAHVSSACTEAGLGAPGGAHVALGGT